MYTGGQWQNVGAVSYNQLSGIVPVNQLSGTYNISITGNQATQTKLQTARKINGVDFDGTQDITIKQSTPFKINFLIGTNVTASFDGSANVNVSVYTIGAQPAGHDHDSLYLRRDATVSMFNTSLINQLNADLLDGKHQNDFQLASHTHSNYLSTSGGTISGDITINGRTNANGVVNCNTPNGRFVLPVGTNKYAV